MLSHTEAKLGISDPRMFSRRNSMAEKGTSTRVWNISSGRWKWGSRFPVLSGIWSTEIQITGQNEWRYKMKNGVTSRSLLDRFIALYYADFGDSVVVVQFGTSSNFFFALVSNLSWLSILFVFVESSSTVQLRALTRVLATAMFVEFVTVPFLLIGSDSGGKSCI